MLSPITESPMALVSSSRRLRPAVATGCRLSGGGVTVSPPLLEICRLAKASSEADGRCGCCCCCGGRSCCPSSSGRWPVEAEYKSGSSSELVVMMMAEKHYACGSMIVQYQKWCGVLARTALYRGRSKNTIKLWRPLLGKVRPQDGFSLMQTRI